MSSWRFVGLACVIERLLFNWFKALSTKMNPDSPLQIQVLL